MARYDRDNFITLNLGNIKSPKGTDIIVEILSLKGHQAVDGCVFTGVEIKTNKNQQLTGFRFCAPQAAGKTFRSSTNRVPIITWNKVFKSETVLRFRHGELVALRTHTL
nr:astacin-like metalloprotease [Haemonchus contortus]CDJ96347.1 CBN-NAS-31 protein [Haemonchus contortus]